MIPYLHEPAWERQPREPQRAYQSFCRYREMGAQRQLEPLSQDYPLEQLHKWLSRWQWVERAAAWDQYLAMLWQQHYHHQQQHQQDIWRQRQEQWRETEWEYVRALQRKVDAILSLPVTRQRTVRDGKTVIIEPMNWSLGDVAQLVQLISELGRKALAKPEPALHPLLTLLAQRMSPSAYGELVRALQEFSQEGLDS
ncbi:hypothetical protein GlitD10_1087 [Gloeomargarita lithophora Alchichica-D10]|uniref:Uncharacterized protein n=1 Tax=Gloeomargarita lithophora Alchichica-D10 TaxID=1188229 RepID=A0A1J0ABW6_9CYAN|nr:hypothetical protein [Gloeomargarita lithophora]APB33407.1 hypothetical protein GlitD10_1087 [Gloeomargarita lithophora Alchichica-D10]